MNRVDEILGNQALGLVPVALCVHGGEALPVVIRAVTSKLGFMLVCAICGHVHTFDTVSWHTTDDLTRRFGWKVEDIPVAATGTGGQA